MTAAFRDAQEKSTRSTQAKAHSYSTEVLLEQPETRQQDRGLPGRMQHPTSTPPQHSRIRSGRCFRPEVHAEEHGDTSRDPEEARAPVGDRQQSRQPSRRGQRRSEKNSGGMITGQENEQSTLATPAPSTDACSHPRRPLGTPASTAGQGFLQGRPRRQRAVDFMPQEDLETGSEPDESEPHLDMEVSEEEYLPEQPQAVGEPGTAEAATGEDFVETQQEDSDEESDEIEVAEVERREAAPIGALIDGEWTPPPKMFNFRDMSCPSSACGHNRTTADKPTAEQKRRWRKHVWGAHQSNQLLPQDQQSSSMAHKASLIAGLLRRFRMRACGQCGEPIASEHMRRHHCEARTSGRPSAGAVPNSPVAVLKQAAAMQGNDTTAFETMCYLRSHGLLSNVQAPTRQAPRHQEQERQGGRDFTHIGHTQERPEADGVNRYEPDREWEAQAMELACRDAPIQWDEHRPLPYNLGMSQTKTRRLVPRNRVDEAREAFTAAMEEILTAASRDTTTNASSHSLGIAWLHLFAIPSKFAGESEGGAPVTQQNGQQARPQMHRNRTQYLVDELGSAGESQDAEAMAETARARARTLILEGRLSAAAEALLKPEPPAPPSARSAQQLQNLHPTERPIGADEQAKIYQVARGTLQPDLSSRSLRRASPVAVSAPMIPMEAATAVIQRVRALASTDPRGQDPTRRQAALSGAQEALKRAARLEAIRQLGEPPSQQSAAPEAANTETQQSQGSQRVRDMLPGLEALDQQWGVSLAQQRQDVRDPATVRPIDQVVSQWAQYEHQAMSRAPTGIPALKSFSSLEIASLVSVLPPHRAAGPSGMTYEMLRQLLGRDAHAFALFAAIVRLILAGRGGPASMLMASRLIALHKKGSEVRPIAVGETIMRICGLVATRSCEQALVQALRPEQVGVALPGGTEIAAWTAQAARLSGLPILSVDAKNAFNSVSRREVLRATAEKVPALTLVTTWALTQPTPLFYGGGGRPLWVLASATGVPQGWPLSPALFALALHDQLRAMRGVVTTVAPLCSVTQLPEARIPSSAGERDITEFISTLCPGVETRDPDLMDRVQAMVDQADHTDRSDQMSPWVDGRWFRPLHAAATEVAQRLAAWSPAQLQASNPEEAISAMETVLQMEAGGVALSQEARTSPLPHHIQTIAALALATSPGTTGSRARMIGAIAWAWLTREAVSLASPTMAGVWGEALAATSQGDKHAAAWAYADDVYVAAKENTLSWIFGFVTRSYPTVGLTARRDKSELLTPGESVFQLQRGAAPGEMAPPIQAWTDGTAIRAAQALEATQDANERYAHLFLPPTKQDGIMVVGTPVGTRRYTQQSAITVAQQSGEALRRARGMEAQLMFALLRSSASARFKHLSRTLPPDILASAILTHDREMGIALADVTGVPEFITADAGGAPHNGLGWAPPESRTGVAQRARDLPLRLGGLGVIPVAQTAEAAFIGSFTLVAAEVSTRFRGVLAQAGPDPHSALSSLPPVQDTAQSLGDEAITLIDQAREGPVRKGQRQIHQPSLEVCFWLDVADQAYSEALSWAGPPAQPQQDQISSATRRLAWRMANLSRGASAWLIATPSHPPNRVGDEEFREMVSLRIGLHLTRSEENVEERRCNSCNFLTSYDPAGSAHALLCHKRSKQLRHDRVARGLAKALRQAGLQVSTETDVQPRGISAPRRGRKMDLIVVADEAAVAVDVTIIPPTIGGIALDQRQAAELLAREDIPRYVQEAVGPTGGTPAGTLPIFCPGEPQSRALGQASLQDPLGLTRGSEEAAARKWGTYGRQVWTPVPANPAQERLAPVLPLVILQTGGLHRASAQGLKRMLQANSTVTSLAEQGEIISHQILHILQRISSDTIQGDARIIRTHTLDAIRRRREGQDPIEECRVSTQAQRVAQGRQTVGEHGSQLYEAAGATI